MGNYLSTKDGYSIEYRRNQNKIVIALPQTPTTTTNTFWPVIDRKTVMTDAELASILSVVVYIFKGDIK